ncbi:XrtA system polysaccharide chain length determinant [Spiribacter vilamensis]|uniref:Polysaccharide chain length determinant protein (PEP-CTERM system associated) n=1 Tax=Spiribacter vilamensis TaxID=531306 RepID=A0A4Q8CZG5_9GAMM|nr:XrtA system polysaccharide chain length determinant [Spiribacter vilamensis]RZU98374.1 polysaccharide chain length determinant protein (PEP-CTERM system associated) [Spiribacter vilamensis]TVO60744.1 hypothetical protein FPL09_00830 [Spiribacter vilamensis]
MREFVKYLLGELRGTWRFRWYGLLIAWVVSLAGAASVLTMPDEYRVTARVQLDTQSMLRPLLQDLAVEPNLGIRMRALTATLLRRENVERIATENDLLLTASTPAQEERILERLEQEILIQGMRDSPIYQIGYTANGASQAKGVVQSTLDILTEEAMGVTMSDARSATSFLEEQVDDYEQRLRAAEERLAEFRRANVGMLPNQGGGDFYQRLNRTEEEIENLESDLETAERRRRSLREQIVRLESNPSQRIEQSPRFQQLSEDLRTSQQRLDELLLRYTAEHPDVQTLEDRIERQRQRREALETEDPPDRARTDNRDSLVYQEFQLRLNDLESEIASIRTRLEQRQERRGELLTKVDEITEVEKRLTDLTRNYQSTQQRYQTLISRLQTAQMTTAADRSAGQMSIRLVDPPRTPEEPDGPPRALFMTAVAPVGLGMGGAFAFLLHLVRPVFQSRERLAEISGRPVLGSVSLVLTRRQRQVKTGAIAVFGLATLMLVAAAVGGAIYVDMGVEQFQNLIRRVNL